MTRKLTKKDKDALNAIDSFIREIPIITELQTAKAWKVKVYASLVNWLGKDNANTIAFDQSEGVQVLHHPTEFRPKSNHDNLSRLNQIKDYIKANGVLTEHKNNWLYNADNKWLIGISFTIIAASYGIGLLHGVFIKNKEELKTEKIYTDLRDSLASIKIVGPK